MSKELLQDAKDWHWDLCNTLVSVDLSEEMKAHTRKYRDVLGGLIEQVESLDKLKEYKNYYWGMVKALNNMAEMLVDCEEQIKQYREAIEDTQEAIQKNLSKWNYKDEVALHEVFTKNEKVLEES